MTTSQPATIADAAVLATERGWAVFPCLPDDKRPAVERWEQRACSDGERVARCWPSPRHNVGIACGPSGLVVIDLDAHNELPPEWQLPGISDGRDVLAQLCEWAHQPWPSTYTVATPSGGWHLYYAAPAAGELRNSASLLGPQIDVRASGGYVLGAGSVLGGKSYEIVSDDPPIPLPAWISQALYRRQQRTTPPTADQGSPASRLRGILRAVSVAKDGQRNTVLHWAACRVAELAEAGETDAVTATEALVTAALSAGLREGEARRTIASGLRSGGR